MLRENTNMKRTEASSAPGFSSIGQPLAIMYHPIYIPQTPIAFTSIPVEPTLYPPQSGNEFFPNESSLSRHSNKVCDLNQQPVQDKNIEKF